LKDEGEENGVSRHRRRRKPSGIGGVNEKGRAEREVEVEVEGINIHLVIDVGRSVSRRRLVRGRRRRCARVREGEGGVEWSGVQPKPRLNERRGKKRSKVVQVANAKEAKLMVVVVVVVVQCAS
jgi:hypothetical protein